MRYLLIILLCGMLLMTGCVSASFAPVDTEVSMKPRKMPEQILVFRTAKPKRKYIEIGSVFATGSDDMAYMVELLKRKAAKNGGDAIIDIEAAPVSMSATVIRFVK